uniref:Uncharacterized protein n=1 Tax=Anguilla anguilla TaxID=7936 RepID=A0A0E9XFU9_ANGAN
MIFFIYTLSFFYSRFYGEVKMCCMYIVVFVGK